MNIKGPFLYIFTEICRTEIGFVGVTLQSSLFFFKYWNFVYIIKVMSEQQRVKA